VEDRLARDVAEYEIVLLQQVHILDREPTILVMDSESDSSSYEDYEDQFDEESYDSDASTEAYEESYITGLMESFDFADVMRKCASGVSTDLIDGATISPVGSSRPTNDHRLSMQVTAFSHYTILAKAHFEIYFEDEFSLFAVLCAYLRSCNTDMKHKLSHKYPAVVFFPSGSDICSLFSANMPTLLILRLLKSITRRLKLSCNYLHFNCDSARSCTRTISMRTSSRTLGIFVC